MRAITMSQTGDPEVLSIGRAQMPQADEDEVLIAVRATALNRADLLQRRGLYPPPDGASEILGLEVSGEVVATGSSVTKFKRGDRVMALLPGGGYAEYAAVHNGMVMHVPEGLSDEQAAAIPEAFLTAYLNLFWLGKLEEDQSVLIHAGASGVGTASIQTAVAAGANVWITAGSEEKLQACKEIGARDGWNYRSGSFMPWLKAETSGHGVDIVLDFIGGPYAEDNVNSLKEGGKLILIGTLGGARAASFPLLHVLTRSLTITGTTLRGQPLDRKIKLVEACESFLTPLLETGKVRPVLDKVFHWGEAAKAHQYMEENRNIGKIILKVD